MYTYTILFYVDMFHNIKQIFYILVRKKKRSEPVIKQSLVNSVAVGKGS